MITKCKCPQCEAHRDHEHSVFTVTILTLFVLAVTLSWVAEGL